MKAPKRVKKCLLVATLCTAGLAATPAHAIIPVIDIAAIQSLIQQIVAWAEQLRSMQTQIAQMKETYSSMTGLRGMEQVLRIPEAARNYLPPNWQSLEASVDGNGAGFPQIAAAVQSQAALNAVLTAADVGRFSGPLQSMLLAQRRGIAGNQAVTHLAYAHSSDRFAELATLIDRIATTQDGKAIAELQGRIGAEQAMLANEGAKLTAMAQSAAAEDAARQQAVREQVVANHGTFATRLQPTPPAP